ncbi:MAG: hypothetical protein V3U62_02710 [Sedimenticolaceae bacterium]
MRNDFSACLPELRQCEVHDGRFGLEELRRIATHAPAVADPGTNEIDCELQIVAYIITRDGARLPRGEAARVIAQTLLLKVRANRWGLPDVGAPERLRADNLYSGDIDCHGVALWAGLCSGGRKYASVNLSGTVMGLYPQNSISDMHQRSVRTTKMITCL